MTSLILLLGVSVQLVDLPIKRGSCTNGQCSAPMVTEKKSEKPGITPIVDDKVFRGGKLRFKLRGSSCS